MRRLDGGKLTTTGDPSTINAQLQLAAMPLPAPTLEVGLDLGAFGPPGAPGPEIILTATFPGDTGLRALYGGQGALYEASTSVNSIDGNSDVDLAPSSGMTDWTDVRLGIHAELLRCLRPYVVIYNVP